MEKYRYIPHTADQYIEAYGKTLNELFENTALGFVNMMVRDIKPTLTKRIRVEASTKEELLHNFLNELLVIRDSENLFFSEFRVNIKNNTLEVVARGEEFNSDKHQQDIEIKAITYHNLKIEKTELGFKVKLLVDI